MERTLIAICGLSNVGKTSAAEYLVAQYGVRVSGGDGHVLGYPPRPVFVDDDVWFPDALSRQRFERVLVLHVTAPPETRLRRAHRRGRGELTLERLLAEDRLAPARHVAEVARLASATIANDLDTFGMFEARLDTVMHVWQLAT